jgi:hypothetical protein
VCKLLPSQCNLGKPAGHKHLGPLSLVWQEPPLKQGYPGHPPTPDIDKNGNGTDYVININNNSYSFSFA